MTRVLSAFNYTTIDNPNTEPIRIIRWDFSGGPTLYLTDRVWDGNDGSIKNIFDSQIYEPIIQSWGTVTAGNVDIVTKETAIGQFELVLDNTVAIAGYSRLSELMMSIKPHYSIVTAWEWFYGATVAADLIPIFAGRFEDALGMSRPEITAVFSGIDLDISNKFAHNVLDLTTYPNARLTDVGKMIPQVWGRAQKVPFLGADVGKVDTLLTDIGPTDMSFQITDADGVFPTSGQLLIEEEHVSYGDVVAGVVTVTERGANGTYKRGHGSRSVVEELKSSMIFIIDHAVSAIHDVYYAHADSGRLIKQLTNVTKYTGQAGDQHASYGAKAVIEFNRDLTTFPDGVIIPYTPGGVPAGWTVFGSAAEKYIVGAGAAYTVADIGGTLSVSMATDAGGVHSGTDQEGADTVPGTATDGEYPFGADASAGGHAHDLDFDYTPDTQDVFLIKASGAKTKVPAGAVLFSKSNTAPTGLESFFDGENFLRAAPSQLTIWNSADKNANITLTGSDLIIGATGSAQVGVRGVDGHSSGAFYYEVTLSDDSTELNWGAFGIGSVDAVLSGEVGSLSNTSGINTKSGKCVSSWPSTFHSVLRGTFWHTEILSQGYNAKNIVDLTWPLVTGDVLMVAVDLTARRMWFGVNGTWGLNADPSNGLSPHVTFESNLMHPMASANNVNPFFSTNFGDSAWAYTPPTGFVGWPIASEGLITPEIVENIVLEDVKWSHFHYDDPGVLDAGALSNRDILDKTAGARATHDHSDTLDTQSITQAIKRAFVRAWTNVTVEFPGFVGAIVMYEGAVAPDGWALCDGTGGTPDLRDRFIVLSNDGTTVNAGDDSFTPAFVTAEDGAHSHNTAGTIAAALGVTIYHANSGADNGDHTHNVTTNTNYTAPYYALTFIIRTDSVLSSTEDPPDQDALIVADVDGHPDDGSGTYTGTADMLIEQPDHISRHLIIAKCGKTASEIDSPSYDAAGAQFLTHGFREAIVLLSPPNPRRLLNRIAHQARCLETWEAGVHHLIWVATTETVDKELDQNRVDLQQIWISWTERIAIKNTMSARFKRDWSGKSDSLEESKDLVTADNDASVTEFGILEGEQLSYPYIIDETQAQAVLEWDLADRQSSLLLVEVVGGYYMTDLERGDIVEFTTTVDDWLDLALVSSGTTAVWEDLDETAIWEDASEDAVWEDLTGEFTTRMYRIYEQSRRADASIQLKVAEVIALTDPTSAYSVALSGTVTATIDQNDIKAGGNTIISTITGRTWVSTLGGDNAITTAYRDGLTSAQSEGTGWNAEVRDNIVFGDITRTSDQVVTVTLQAEIGYSINAQETITQTVPGIAVSGPVDEAIAVPTFTVDTPPAAWDDALDVDAVLSNNNFTWRRNISQGRVRSVGQKSSGKYYFEIEVDYGYVFTSTRWCAIGISDQDFSNLGLTADYGYRASISSVWKDGVEQASDIGVADPSLRTETLILAVDFDDNKLWFGRNGTWADSGDPGAGTNPSYSGVGAGPWWLAGEIKSSFGTVYGIGHFQSGTWNYSAPSGFGEWG